MNSRVDGVRLRLFWAESRLAASGAEGVNSRHRLNFAPLTNVRYRVAQGFQAPKYEGPRPRS